LPHRTRPPDDLLSLDGSGAFIAQSFSPICGGFRGAILPASAVVPLNSPPKGRVRLAGFPPSMSFKEFGLNSCFPFLGLKGKAPISLPPHVFSGGPNSLPEFLDHPPSLMAGFGCEQFARPFFFAPDPAREFCSPVLLF